MALLAVDRKEKDQGGGLPNNNSSLKRRTSIQEFLSRGGGGGGAKKKMAALRNATAASGNLRTRTSPINAGGAVNILPKTPSITSPPVGQTSPRRYIIPASLEGKFTPAQVSTFQDLFSYYDKDGSGDISRDELAKVLETLGESVTDSKLDEMIAEVDQDGDGELSWESPKCPGSSPIMLQLKPRLG